MKRHLLIALLLILPAMGRAAAEPDPAILQQQAEATVTETQRQQPAYAWLAEQQTGFLMSWREQLRQYMAVNDRRNAQDASRAIAAALGLNASTAYIGRADDAAVNALLEQQQHLMLMAQHDAVLCGILLDTATARSDESGRMPWLLRKPYRAVLPNLESAVSRLVTSAQGMPARLLPENQRQPFIRRIAARVDERHGREGLDDLERLQNSNAAPALRCRGAWRLLEAISEQPSELRAQLMRIYFGP